MKEIIEKYGLVYGKRYSNRQKEIFVEELTKDLRLFCHDIELLKTKKQINNSTHILVNDPKSKDVVVVSSYDTLSKSILKNMYYPFNNLKNQQQAIKELGIAGLLFLFAIAISFSLVYYAFMINQATWLKLTTSVIAVILGVGSFRIINGRANIVNYNRNSMAVCLCIDLIKSQNLPNVGFVFLDNASDSFKGFKELSEYLNEDKEIIYLNCIAEGELLCVVHRSDYRVDKEWIKTKLKDAHHKTFDDVESKTKLFSLFPKLITIVCGDRMGKELVVKEARSNRDYRVDLKRIELIKQAIISRKVSDYEKCL